MFKRILTTILLLLFVLTPMRSTSELNALEEPRNDIRLVVIVSYDQGYYYRNQLDYFVKQGVGDAITSGKNVKIKTYFLNYDPTHHASFQANRRALFESIKSWSPTHVVVNGSPAFLLLGADLTKLNVKIMVTCLDHFDDVEAATKGYPGEVSFHMHSLKLPLQLLHDNNTVITDFYFLHDRSQDSLHMYTNLRDELLVINQQHNIKNFEVSTLQELKMVLKRIQDGNRGMLIPLFTEIPDADTGQIVGWNSVAEVIEENNYRHLEVILNDNGSGQGMAISVFHMRMPCKRAEMPKNSLIQFLDDTKSKASVTEAHKGMVLNRDRLHWIGFEQLLGNTKSVQCIVEDER